MAVYQDETRTRDVFALDIGRTITGNVKRFASIALICALGVSIMIGLRAGCEDLRRSVDAYFSQQNVYDISMQGTLGLSDDDVDAVAALDGVDVAEGIYSETVYTPVGKTIKRAAVQSLSQKDIDQPVLIDGDLPEAADEVAVTSSYLKRSKKKIGDTLTFEDKASANNSGTEGDDEAGAASTTVFRRGTYTITAEVADPTDIAANTGSSFRATGTNDYAFYVDESAASISSYTAIHVRVDSSSDLYCFSADYTDKVADVMDEIERIRHAREKARRKELLKDTSKMIELQSQQALSDLAASGLSGAQLKAQQQTIEEQAAASLKEASDSLGSSTWYVQDRSGIGSFASVDSDMSSIEAIATAFPAIFFVVAVLISLTTATRMVEEERTLIGLYKALGYGRNKILSKYVGYALAACLVGGIVGNLVGFIALPLFLFHVFTSMYVVPNMQLFYSAAMSIGSVALFAVGVAGAALIACRRELAESPAALMRPKAPRAGSRILLERVRPLWSRLGFLNKVTARNLFRYKMRFFMTTFGIAGCCALVICGLGIRDTVVGLSDRQYGGVTRYDLLAVSTSGELADLTAELEGRAAAEGSKVSLDSKIAVQLESVTAEFGGKKESVQIVVVPTESVDALGRYVRLADADGGSIELGNAGCDLSKSAQMVLGAKPGEKIELQDSALDTASVRVASTSMNYLGSTVYLSQDAYEKAFGKKMQANALIAKLDGGADDQIDFCRSAKADGWLSVSSTADQVKNFEKNFAIINAVVVLVTAMAAALSFVVVFTLSNTNISERERELATIKVLGFNRREVHRYVNKETLILTGIGAVVGVPLGYVLARSFTYVLQMPSLYFDVHVQPVSYVIAVALSFVFTIVVNQATNRSLNRIDMVGALKSAE